MILASTSRYRRELLARLGLPFRSIGPEVDETPRRDEMPRTLALRLAEAKALAVASRFPGTLVIGSDQVAELDGRALGKPGTLAAAETQLAASSGRCVQFHTALCLADTRGGKTTVTTAADVTRVVFRSLENAEIRRYLEIEQPFDCAGSFKCEGLGITLFERIENEDPTALIGLPLIALSRMLRAAGVVRP